MLKCAVVGMGGIGNTHARCYHEDPLSELVAVCDLVKEKADAAAEKFGVKAFYDEEEMLKAMPEIDIVSVTTSGYDNGSMHFEPAMLALSYGKNVLVEKPICADINDARELVKYASKQKVYLGCDLNHYFSGPAFAADQLIKDKKVGELVYCIHKVGFNGSETKYGGPGAPRWQTPYSHIKAFCAHPFSVMRHFCGDITGVQAFLSKPGVRATACDPMLSINSIHVPGAPADQACGRGEINLYGYFKALVDAKYDGPVCLEVIGPELTMQKAQSIAAESYGYMNAILKMLGTR